jgi:MYXO-CTERM domain-containing protein
MRTLVAAAVAAATLALSPSAEAFCGFYVAGADAKLFADATQVVLMREGTRTVLSMQNDYKGPPEKFAMVVPVPTVLQKDQVKTLARTIFEKVDRLGAPRLVEYWEQDPCATGIGLGNIGTIGLGLSGTGQGGGGMGYGSGGVKVEARYAVGEYEIVILSAKDSSGLDAWLREEKYAIPEGAEPLLRPYVQAGMKFFVAKVDPTKVKFENGRAALSPIRFHYDSDKFTLPMKLGLINSSGTQDLVVSVLAKGTRYEAANYPNVTIPTNLDVTEQARARFGEFYAALFDKTLEKTPRAVVTEYAWDAGTCDPCPGPTLDGTDLATLGADVMPSGLASVSGGGGIGQSFVARSNPTLKQGLTTVTGKMPPEVVQRIVRQSFGRFRFCYDAALMRNPRLEGRVSVQFTLGANGEVVAPKVLPGGLEDATMAACVRDAFAKLTFPQPDGTVGVTYALMFSPPDPNAPAPAPPRFFGSSSSYVLTRLHVRYGKESLGEDLVFKAATAIAGGREMRTDGKVLENGAQAAPTNNFQARYAIRHPWMGEVACKEPNRGIWGGPPKSDSGLDFAPAPLAAQKTAFVPRGALALASFVTTPVSELGVTPSPGVSVSPALAAPSLTDASPLDASDASDASTGGADATKPKSGCAGCTTSPAPAPLPISLAVLGLALAASARRRRRT